MAEQEMLWFEEDEPDEQKPRKPRPPDAIWDTMEELFGRVMGPSNAHRKRNRAVRDLKVLGATREGLLRAFQSYQARFSCLCTDVALATHYPLLTTAQPQMPPRRFGRGVTARELVDQVREETNGHHPGPRVAGDPGRGLPRGSA